MKNLFFVLTIASAAIVGMQSCKKEQQDLQKPAITQTENVQLRANESYTFVLIKNKRDDEYRFTTQAQHYSISTLGVDANGNRVYQYTPALNYVGTDQVVVSNDWERNESHDPHGNCTAGPPPPPQGNGGPQGGNCNGGEEDHYIVTINFVIDNSVSKTTR
ncbi:MAG TPA: hypothetical protein VFJ43_12590 [Bacteroidia bacterium]|nr:hypothetical protein [Bacteroidia bacterium]